MRTVFKAVPGEGAMLTIGSTGWITGQSYMLAGPLVAGVRSVLLEGSPISPSPLRFAYAIESQKCTMLQVTSNPKNPKAPGKSREGGFFAGFFFKSG